jgi:hypothetical protein
VVGELENCCGLFVVSCCCEKLVAEARGQFGNPEEGGTSVVGSRYQAETSGLRRLKCVL